MRPLVNTAPFRLNARSVLRGFAALQTFTTPPDFTKARISFLHWISACNLEIFIKQPPIQNRLGEKTRTSWCPSGGEKLNHYLSSCKPLYTNRGKCQGGAKLLILLRKILDRNGRLYRLTNLAHYDRMDGY